MTFSHEAVALCNTRWLSILSQPPLSHNTLKNKNSKVLNHEATVRAIEGFFLLVCHLTSLCSLFGFSLRLVSCTM